jgi:hypothetical protein
MLRHEHICPKIKSQVMPCVLDDVGEPSATAIGIEELETLITREREFVGVTGLVIVSAVLGPMRANHF